DFSACSASSAFKRRIFSQATWPPLEVELDADFEQAAAHDLNRVLPHVVREGVASILIQHGVRVEEVVDVEIRPQPGIPKALEIPQPEGAVEAHVDLLDSLLEDLGGGNQIEGGGGGGARGGRLAGARRQVATERRLDLGVTSHVGRSEEHTSELQSRVDLVCRLLLEK